MASVGPSWEKAKASWDKAGPELFMKLFEDDAIYGKFKDVTFGGAAKGTVKDTESMKKQSNAFAGLISTWVANVNDDAKLTASCNDFAKNHKARGVSAAQVSAAFAEFRKTMTQFGGNAGEWETVTKALEAKINPGL